MSNTDAPTSDETDSRPPATVSPETIDGLRLRQALGDGTIEGEDFDISLNMDGQAVFIDFDSTEGMVQFSMSDMIAVAYEHEFGGDDA